MRTFVAWERSNVRLHFHSVQECGCHRCVPTRSIAKALLGWMRFGQVEAPAAPGVPVVQLLCWFSRYN